MRVSRKSITLYVVGYGEAVIGVTEKGDGNLDATVNRQQKPLTKLVASKPGFYRADTWASNGHACPHRAQSGASGTQKAQPPPDKVTRQEGALLCDQKANENGNLTAQVRKINNSTIS